MAANELETTSETVEEEAKDDALEVEVVDVLTEESEAKTESADDETEAKVDVLIATEDSSDEVKEAADAVASEEKSVPEILSELTETKEAAFDDLHVKRMTELGIDSPELLDAEAFLCVSTKSMVSEPCGTCRGGCAPEGELPGILDIEVMAKSDHEGEIVRSGYAPAEAIFFVDIKREDGKFIEAVYGGDGEALGWNLLDSDIIAEKSVEGAAKIITMTEAEEIAIKELGGSAVSVEAALFEGHDTYVVEIDTLDGKSYDAYVTLDGEVAGWDEYLMEDAEEKAAVPGAPIAPAAAAPAAPAEDDTVKLVSMIETVTDPAKLKAVIDAIGEDIADVPEPLKAVIIKKATALKVPEIIPEVWKKKPVAAPAAAAPAAAAPAAPAAAEKSVEVTVDGEADETFASSMAEFKAMQEVSDTEESE